MPQIIDSVTIEQELNSARMVRPPLAITKTLNGNTALSSLSNTAVLTTGDALGYSLTLPNATTLLNGRVFEVYNSSNSTLTINFFGGTLFFVVAQNSIAYFYLESNATTAGSWRTYQVFADPAVASGIVNYIVTSSTTFTTLSLTDTLITGFSVTPQAGTYGIWYNASITIGTNNALHRATVYKNGVAITDSTRAAQASGGGWAGLSSTMTTAQFNGTEACDVRVRVSTGTTSVLDRTLIMIRLGN